VKIRWARIVWLLFLLRAEGFPGEPSSQEASCRLPFPPGISYRVICGPGELHYHGSPRNRFAYDFDLPPGSEVCAGRPGVVIRTESRFDLPTGRSEDNNLIALKHEDGLVSEYHHLLQDGVLVRVGERVEAGEVIGFSGASGKAEGAHLHFVVLSGENSVPVRFEECPREPRKGELCTSRNVPPPLIVRYQELEGGRRGCAFLLSEGQIRPAQVLLEIILKEPKQKGLGPGERRRDLALRGVCEELSVTLKVLRRQSSEAVASQKPGVGGQ
jgi:murein DD-endopeptidase MepM/ murein hydrolase activator NlpD